MDVERQAFRLASPSLKFLSKYVCVFEKNTKHILMREDESGFFKREKTRGKMKRKTLWELQEFFFFYFSHILTEESEA